MTFALENAPPPFAPPPATLGTEAAMAAGPHLAGLNLMAGRVRHQAMAEAVAVALVA